MRLLYKCPKYDEKKRMEEQTQFFYANVPQLTVPSYTCPVCTGGIPELTLEDVQEEPSAGAQLYTPLLGEQFEIILEAKIPTLPRRWRRSYVRKFGYRWAKKIARGRRLAKVKERWRVKAEIWKDVTRIVEQLAGKEQEV